MEKIKGKIKVKQGSATAQKIGLNIALIRYMYVHIKYICFHCLIFIHVLLYCLLGRSVQSDSCFINDDQQLNLKTLEAIIRDESCGVKSIDDLLPMLPSNYRSNFVLMYRSQSLQGPHNINYQNPRAILFPKNKRQNIFLSFNGHPSLKNHNNIELLEAGNGENELDPNIFKLVDISFPSDSLAKSMTWSQAQSNIVVSDPNPQKCLTCHGAPVRPIFQSYPIWEGAYGSFHLYGNETERIELGRFVNEQMTNTSSRYRHLEISEGSGQTPMMFTGLSGILTGHANSMFNSQLAHYNNKRIHRILKASAFYPSFAPAILAATAECSDFESYFPSSIKNKLNANISSSHQLSQKYHSNVINKVLREIYEAGPSQFGFAISMIADSLRPDQVGSLELSDFVSAHRNHWDSWDTMNLLWIDTLRRQGPHRGDPGIAKLRYIVEGLGISMTNWFIDIVQPTYRMSDGTAWSFRFAMELLNNDESLSEFVGLLNRNNLHTEAGVEAKNHICESLKLESHQRLSSVANLPTLERASFDLEIQIGSFPKTFINTCAQCHTHQQIGPYIPFTDSADFIRWLKQEGNKENLLYRVQTQNPLDRMPLNRVLDGDELSNIINYVNEVSAH